MTFKHLQQLNKQCIYYDDGLKAFAAKFTQKSETPSMYSSNLHEDQ